MKKGGSMRLLAALLCALALPAAALAVRWEGAEGRVWVDSVRIQDEAWLFLPSGTDLSALRLDGRDTDWRSVSREEAELPGVYTGRWEGEPLHVAVSRNVRSVHLFSDDPETRGRAWLEDCELHQKTVTGRVMVLRPDGSVSLDAKLRGLRGRGNSTWQKAEYKKPYQFKLETREDVLETGLPSERCRTWVLLSNEQDESLLRNQLALDLARELGLESSSRCEPVDLFYDGDYRGAYLLAEKVEVGEHSVDVKDFDKLLEPVNRRMGVPDPDSLPSPTRYGNVPPEADGVNARGLGYGLSDGVYDQTQVDAGGYLLEIEAFGTLSEQAWFALPNGRYVSVKSPEYAGDTMLRYVSEAFLKLYDTLMNYGWHPETGEPVERFLDVDSYVRSHLVQELLLCSTSYSWSSTYFVLPEGETRFYAGPVWDFDRSVDENWPGLKDNNLFSHAFYRTTAFQRAAKAIWAREVRPACESILFGGEEGQSLHPLSRYAETLRASWQMDFCRHRAATLSLLRVPQRFDNVMSAMETFLREQYAFLSEEIAAWGEDEPTAEVSLTFLLPYGAAEDTSLIALEDEPHGSLFLTEKRMTRVREATEDADALWRADFVLRPKPHGALCDEVTVWVNGTPFVVTPEEGGLRLSFTFEDPSYRPAVLDGVDYGMVFRYEEYVDAFPELLEVYGDDREAVLRAFVEEGMEMGDAGNAFFDPMSVFESDERTAERFGLEWRRYYEAFMESPGRWMISLDNVYEPELTRVAPGA